MSNKFVISPLGKVLAVTTWLRIRGSRGLGPTVTLDKVEEFENKHSVKLPEDYKLFITTVGIGGQLFHNEYFERFEDSAKWYEPNPPFPFKSDQPINFSEPYGGYIVISEVGCGSCEFLVVNGLSYGEIWLGNERLVPYKMDFAGYLLHRFKKELPDIEPKRLVNAVRPGTPKDTLIVLFGERFTETTENYGESRICFQGVPAEFLMLDDKVKEKFEV